MKLCTFVATPPHKEQPGGSPPRLGAVVGSADSRIVDLACAAQTLNPSRSPGDVADITCLTGMQAFLSDYDRGLTWVGHLLAKVPPDLPEVTFSRDQVSLLAPLPRPLNIRDCMAYRRHFQQGLRGGARFKFPIIARADAFLRRLLGISLIRVPALYSQMPVYYKGNPGSVVGTHTDVRWPAYSRFLDYELEVGFYICRTGKNITLAEAPSFIGGYTLFNDFSARDTQLREMDLRLGPAKGKDFDTGNAMGPWMTTPDEFNPMTGPEALARVNGHLWTRSSLADPQFSPAEIIHYISRDETLFPGDFIGLGTVPDGCGLEHGGWIQAGDEVELEVPGLGVLRNRVVAPG